MLIHRSKFVSNFHLGKIPLKLLAISFLLMERTHINYIRHKCYYCQSKRLLAQSVIEIFKNDERITETCNWYFGTKIPDEARICDLCFTFINKTFIKPSFDKRGKPKIVHLLKKAVGNRTIGRAALSSFPNPNYGKNWLVSENFKIVLIYVPLTQTELFVKKTCNNGSLRNIAQKYVPFLHRQTYIYRVSHQKCGKLLIKQRFIAPYKTLFSTFCRTFGYFVNKANYRVTHYLTCNFQVTPLKQ